MKWERKAKAQDLLNKLTAKYKDNLNYYSKLKSSEQSSLALILRILNVTEAIASDERKWRFKLL
jgi:hypothetical protein